MLAWKTIQYEILQLLIIGDNDGSLLTINYTCIWKWKHHSFSLVDKKVLGFMRACNIFSLGGLLYISDSHYYKIIAFLGSCNNKCAELMAVRTLLMVAMSKRISWLHVFRDSSLVISWMNQKLLIQNVHLQALAEQVINHKEYFGEVTFTHICQQKNKQTDTLYKQALQLDTDSLWL